MPLARICFACLRVLLYCSFASPVCSPCSFSSNVKALAADAVAKDAKASRPPCPIPPVCIADLACLRVLCVALPVPRHLVCPLPFVYLLIRKGRHSPQPPSREEQRCGTLPAPLVLLLRAPSVLDYRTLNGQQRARELGGEARHAHEELLAEHALYNKLAFVWSIRIHPAENDSPHPLCR
jgi:hypothetical protein